MANKKSSYPFGENHCTAKDLSGLVGFSYRQINNWDTKGVLPKSDGKTSGWRKYSPQSAFVIMVCVEIRKRFGIPLESLGLIKRMMLKEKADHLRASIELIEFGSEPYLVTDLKATFILQSSDEIENLSKAGLFRDDAGFIVLSLKPIVIKLSSHLAKRMAEKTHEEN